MKPLLRTSAALVVVAALVLAACQPKESSSQAIAADLHGYMQELSRWEPKEKAIFGAVEDVERSQYVDDDYVARTLKSALPTLDDHLRTVGAFRPRTPEILDIHDHYKKGYEDMRVAMQHVISSVSAKNYVELATAKTSLKKSYTEVLKAFRALDLMLEEHDAEIKAIEKS